VVYLLKIVIINKIMSQEAQPTEKYRVTLYVMFQGANAVNVPLGCMKVDASIQQMSYRDSRYWVTLSFVNTEV